MNLRRLLYWLLACALSSPFLNAAFPDNPELEQRIQTALQHAENKLTATMAFLEQVDAASTDPNHIPHYPESTKNSDNQNYPASENGQWHTRHAASAFWAKGSFAGLLWMMADHATDPTDQDEWQNAAVKYSEPLINYRGNDLTVNNYAVFRRWLDQTDNNTDQQRARDAILRAARLLVEPYDRATDTGRFFEPGGIYGYDRKAKTDGILYFHAFIDHTPNVHHLLGASLLADSETEALRFRKVAISHILNLHQTMGPRRDPGDAGSWQRAFFDWDPSSPTYGEFLFNEGKQGWSNRSTWSRGQAWWLYGCSLAYYHSRHPETLPAAREAARFFVDHLPHAYPEPHRQEGIFIPPWDFDYAWEVDFSTEYDTSAAAIAAAGLVRLVAALPANDPDYEDFLTALTGLLHNLTGPPFLTADDGPEMSLLRHGSYHHPDSLVPSSNFDNGLIWGDYFLVDAITAYQKLRADPPATLQKPTLHWVRSPEGLSLHWPANEETVYQLQFSPDLQQWEDQDLPIHTTNPSVTHLLETTTSGFWRFRQWEANLLP